MEKLQDRLLHNQSASGLEFATKFETIDYIDKKTSKSSRDIKTYQNISRIQIAKRVKRRNRRNDETSRVGPCNSAPLH